MKEETRIWIEKVDQDLKTVEILLQSDEGPPGIICFHCQQAAEKFLKAILVERNIEFPRTHDLLLLIEGYIIPVDCSFTKILPLANELNEFAISTRYPDSVEEVDIIVARDAYKATLDIKSLIFDKINNSSTPS